MATQACRSLLVLFVLCAGQLAVAQRSLLGADQDCAHKHSQWECCKRKQCAWCAGSATTGCVSAVAAKYIIDAKIGQCQGAAIPAQASSACDAQHAQPTCTSNRNPQCAWCVVPTTGAGGCVPDQAAQFLSSYAKDCSGPGSYNYAPYKGGKQGGKQDCNDCENGGGKGKGSYKGKDNNNKGGNNCKGNNWGNNENGNSDNGKGRGNGDHGGKHD